jgi:hypothetical protein
MVRALLDGRKTQTRRTLKPKKHACLISDGWADSYVLDPGNRSWLEGYYPWRIGDRLWVRETWKPHSIYAAIKPRDVPQSRIFYACDGGSFPSNTPWRPGIFMPRWASRLTLTVTDVRVERLQAISEEDSLAEGSQEPSLVPIVGGCWSERQVYANLWNHINGAGAWDANPWVVAVTFRAAQHNIDQVPLITQVAGVAADPAVAVGSAATA